MSALYLAGVVLFLLSILFDSLHCREVKRAKAKDDLT